jgi:hypothetical protein
MRRSLKRLNNRILQKRRDIQELGGSSLEPYPAVQFTLLTIFLAIVLGSE